MSLHTLPDKLKPIFWDYDFKSMSWKNHSDFIIRRLLQNGDWTAVCWLRDEVGDKTLREWLLDHQGGSLRPRQLRFWEIVLELDSYVVSRWIEATKNSPWESRVAR